MKRNQRELEANTRGSDVEALQSELRRLGFRIEDRGGFFGPDTSRAVRGFQREQGIKPADGVVDNRTAARIAHMLAVVDGPQPFMVRGRVLDADGDAVPGQTVRAFSVDLEEERLLGRAETDARGGYAIAYDPDGGDSGLEIRVFATATARRPLASSPLILGPEPAETLNLALTDTPFRQSSVGRLQAALEAETDLAVVATMTARSRALLARRTGVSERRIAQYAQAQELAQRTGVDAEIFLGLWQAGAPTDLGGLVIAGTPTLRAWLGEAARRNILPAAFGDRLDAVVEQVRDAAVDEILAGRGGPAGDVAALLATTGLSTSEQRRFLRAHLENDDLQPEFWRRLRQDDAFDDDAVDDLQLTLQLGALTLNHAPLVRVIKEREPVADARELAALDVDEWLRLMDTVDPPEAFRGSSRAYAEAVTSLMSKAYPTARLLSRWTRDDELGTDAFRTFLENNPDFELRDTTVRTYLAQNPAALSGVAEPQAFVAGLEGVGRLFGLVPDDDKFDSVRTLWQADVRSAQAAVGLGRGRFLRRFSEALGEELAVQVYARARQTTAQALAVLAKYSPAFNRMPAVLAGLAVEDPPDEISDWETLFGSLDFCECRHCRSILSPAAYYVDLLQFLGRADLGDRSALEAFLDRRPDLAHARLDCENTNTPIPYIDLVNEALENAVDNGLDGLASNPHLQTTAPADALRANPQHIDTGAYETLAEATFLWSLPFSLWHEERETYLGDLGIRVWELMEVLHRDGEAPEAADRAAAYLGMTRPEREIVVGRHGGHGLGTTDAVLTLMERSQTRFDTLTRLLTSRFVNPSEETVVFADGSCALADATLELSGSERDRLHRFQRLLRITELSVFDLDVAIEFLSAGDIDDAFLIQLAFLKRLGKRLRVAVPELVTWWAPAGLVRENPEGNSLYDRLFLNPAVNNPLNPIEEVFGLNATATDLATPRPLLDPDGNLDPAAGVLVVGALNLTEAELRLLIGEALPTPELNLSNLSHLQRVASLTRALGISVHDYLSLVRLTGRPGVTAFDLPANTVAAGSPEQTWDWMETAARLREPGLSIAEVDYLLAHRSEPSFTVPLSDAGIGLALTDLRAELRKLRPVATGAQPPTPQELEEITGWLAEHLTGVVEQAEEALRIVRGTSTLPAPDQAAFVETHLAALFDPQALAALGGEGDRLVFVYRSVVAYLARSLVVQRLAVPSGLDVAVAQALLVDHLTAPQDPSRPAVDIYLADEFVTSDADPFDPLAFSAAYAVLRRLAKLSLVLGRLGIAAGDVGFLLEQGPTLGWYDLRSLPVEPVAEEALGTDSWMRLVRAFALNRRLFSPSFSLTRLLRAVQEPGAGRDAVLATLAEQAGWELASLEWLAGEQGYALSFPDDFGDEGWLDRLDQAFALVRKAGVSGAQIWSWNVPEADDALARQIKNAAKARYTTEAWLAAAPKLSDALRIRRRDALVDFVVGTEEGIDDSDDLYGRLLIDPAVQPCFLTSRIKQAISSAQLFAHRVFLGLEPDVRFGAEEAAEWPWRKSYRVWEAARQVWCHPENFAEPGLRDDKSPLFRELEESLLQEEVTAPSVERAYLRYLRGLDEVARLELAGLYVEEEANVVHIFARTYGTPHRYFYRRWLRQASFTAWEEVPVNIEGDHLMPVVYNRRLWLLWCKFEDEAVESAPSKDDEPGRPRRHYRILLSWSQYEDGRWTSPKTSSSAISTRAWNSKTGQDIGPFAHGPRRRYYFWAEVLDGDLNIFPYYHHHGDDPHGDLQPNQYFRFRGCNDDAAVITDTGYFDALGLPGIEGVHVRRRVPYRVPKSSHRDFMKFRQDAPLTVFSQLLVDERTIVDHRQELVLTHPPDRFLLTPPHQYQSFFTQAPFFYEDRRRTFMVVPEDVLPSGLPESTVLLTKDDVGLGLLSNVRSALLPGIVASAEPERPVILGHQLPSDGVVFGGSEGSLVIDRRGGTEAELDAEIDERSTETPSAQAGPAVGVDLKGPESLKKYRFLNFYHPYSCLFIEQVNRFGLDGLLKPEPKGRGLELHRQLTPGSPFKFSATYGATGAVQFPSPEEEIDFSPGGSYSLYNWELFFHIPLLIADRLSQNQRFQEAQGWYHSIFDPTEADEAGLASDERLRRFWKIKPFFEFSAETSIQEIVELVNQGDPDYENEVAAWEQDPFNPHRIARVRIVAYMKLVVMKYLDNLIAWADNLFRQDTIESINEATQLYVLAAQILGRRPVEVPGNEAAPRAFAQLRPELDTLSNALVELENRLMLVLSAAAIKSLAGLYSDGGAAGRSAVVRNTGVSAVAAHALQVTGASAAFAGGLVAVSDGDGGARRVLYFCVPHNQKLLGYFATLADRLLKVRNCLNIEGVARALDLFEPPIDPALLVKAAAAGVDLTSALDDLSAPLPHFRFTFMVQKTLEFCGEVKALGGELLAALEKKDAEELAALRASHQADAFHSARGLKQQAINEAREGLEGLRRTRDVIEQRFEHYRSLKFTSATEKQQIVHLETAHVLQLTGQGFDLAANVAHLFPDAKLGVQGISSPEVTISFGGSYVGQALQAYSKYFGLLAGISTHNASMAGIKASHERRKEEWDFQAQQASRELEQVDRQIAAAEIRVAIATSDLANLEQQIAQAHQEQAFLEEKFTSAELYGRLASQISTVYFQLYGMAYDLAKRTERCFRHETGVENTNFVAFGYWENLTKGLHAGERLLKDVRRMEAAYLDQGAPEYEITQHLPLALLNPRALLQLRETGRCTFDIPELALDIAYPGHYRRRYKAVGLTVPCVTGPYTNVAATLTLLQDRMRVSPNVEAGYAYTGLDDTRFRHNLGGVQSIVTSNAQNDRGAFEFSFRDERFLPFEGAGVASSWELSLPGGFRAFDYDTVSDIVLHVSYTAREGGAALRQAAEAHVAAAINDWLDEVAGESGLLRLVSFKREFPNPLHQLLFPSEGEPQATELPVTRRLFPYALRERELTATQAVLVITPKEDQTIAADALVITLNGVQGSDFTADTNLGGVPTAQFDLDQLVGSDGSPWPFAVVEGSLDPEVIDDIYLLLNYTVSTA